MTAMLKSVPRAGRTLKNWALTKALNQHLPALLNGDAFAFHEAWPEMSSILAAANPSPLGLTQKLGELGIQLTGMSAPLLSGLYSPFLLGVAIAAGRVRCSAVGSARIRVALLSLGAMRSGGAWADYITTASLRVLSLSYLDLVLSRPGKLFVVVSAVFLFFLPGIVPLGGSPSVPVMMILSIIGLGIALADIGTDVDARGHYLSLANGRKRLAASEPWPVGSAGAALA